MVTKIDNMIPRQEYPAPGVRVIMIDVFYTSEKGYRGMVTVPKEGLTQDKLQAAVKADAAVADAAIGSHF